jgi:hypothetical protein
MGKYKHFTFLLLGLACYCFAPCQVSIPYFGKQYLINGYAKAIEGESIPYFSVYPQFAKEALLTRCTDGKKIIEWETDPIPAAISNSYAYFTWIAAHSTSTSGGVRYFDLYINDKYVLTFSTHPNNYPPYWTFAANDSTRLVFEFKTRDGAGDAHGMAYLRVPVSEYKKGMPLRLKVVGQNQNSDDWYMTFKYSFKEKIEVVPLPFILKDGANNKQPLQLTALHFGAPAKMTIKVNPNTQKEFTVQNGFNVFEVPVDTVKSNTSLVIKASIGKIYSLDTTVMMTPVVYREIDLVHHAHTDIGYSDIQENVIKIHNENIRRALQLIEKTKDYPEESRFKWNIESAWAVENFLEEATDTEKQLFFNAVKNKQIAISATYANILTGLCTPEEMDWITEYARELRDKMRLPINTAMMSDVPGMNWSMVSALAQNGIRYFSNGPNYVGGLPDKGDRIGHTLREQGNKAFWWKSSSGKDSILFWTCGKGYSSWHGTPQGGVAQSGAEKIAAYMNELSAANYPYSMVQWRYNIVSDNGPTDSTISDFVKKWNEKYVSPKLVLVNVSEMFERFEKLYGDKIPVLSGDFTPYWEDGAYSTAKEEADTRLLSEKLLALENIANQKRIAVNKDWLYRAKRDIVMFHEHTWGAWCSISKPDDPFTIHQWEYKKRFADSAAWYINKIESSVLKNDSNSTNLTVVNTLSWSRSGYVELNVPSSFNSNMLTDDEGNKIPLQKNAEGKLCFIAKDVPAKGEKTYKLSNESASSSSEFRSSINYNIDSTTGAISNLSAKDIEWVDKNSRVRDLLQTLYVYGLDPDSASGSSFKSAKWIEEGPVTKTLRVECGLQGTNSVIYEVTQFNDLDDIKLSVIIDKKMVREKESVHIAFPFAVPVAITRIGVDSSFITPEQGQIPGANKDFFSVQRWIDVSNQQNGVTLCSPQGALFEVGDLVNEEKINNGYKKWKEAAHSSSSLFLYAMNNYWHTNYKADQEDKVRFDFYLSFHEAFDAKNADRFGYEMTQPLVGIFAK